MKNKTTNKRQFTLIELIIVIVVIGILAGMALPKFIGVQRNAKVAAMETDLDVIEKAVMQYVTATDDGSYPFIDVNGDKTINEEDLYFKTGTIPQTLTDSLLKANGDDGSKIYKLDMDKLKPYISKIKYPDTEYLYSEKSDTAIDPIGKADGDNFIHHIIGSGNVGDSTSKEVLYDIYKIVDGFLYASKKDNSLTFYDYSSTSQNPTGRYGDVQDGDVFMGDNYVYRFRKDGTVECIYNGRYSVEMDLTPLTNNGDKINLEKDLIQTSMNGLNLLTESGNLYHFQGGKTIYSNTKYKGELNPANSKLYSCYYVYFTIQTDKSLYLIYGGYNMATSYKIDIPGGITDKDKVYSVGITTYIVKEDGTIYFTNYNNGNTLLTIDTSKIPNGIDVVNDTFINAGQRLWVIKQNGDMYAIDGTYTNEYQLKKIDTSKLTTKVEGKNLKVFTSNDYWDNVPMLIDSKNNKIFTISSYDIKENDISFNENEDLIRRGSQTGLYLVKKDGTIYRQYSGIMKIIAKLSDFNIDFNSKTDSIEFNNSDNFTVGLSNGDKYYFKQVGDDVVSEKIN